MLLSILLLVKGYQWLKERVNSEEGRRQLAKIKELHLLADRLGCTAAQLAIGTTQASAMVTQRTCTELLFVHEWRIEMSWIFFFKSLTSLWYLSNKTGSHIIQVHFYLYDPKADVLLIYYHAQGTLMFPVFPVPICVNCSSVYPPYS